jgi:putative ABC transport system permease protein
LRRQLDVVLRRQTPGQWRAGVQTLRDALAGRYRASFWYLLAAVVLVLLISCLNVAGLFLGRLVHRMPEFATRVALGATRVHLARQLLAEAAVIGVTGGAAGLAITWFGVSALRLLPARRLPFWNVVSLDWRVTAASAALTGGAIALVSVVPLIVFTPQRLFAVLRDRITASSRRSRLRSAFVSAQVALSLVLLAAAGAIGRVLLDAELRDIGMAKHSVLFVQLQPRVMTDDDARVETARLVEQLRHVPGVVAVGAQGTQPRKRAARGAAERARGTFSEAPAMTVESPAATLGDAVAPNSSTEVTAEYFSAMGVPIVRGRGFGSMDGPSDPPVAIIDEATARHMFPGTTPIGRRVKFGALGDDFPWMTIVGVSSSVRSDPLNTGGQYRPRLYRPATQFPAFPSSIIVRVSGRSYGPVAAIRRAIADVDPKMPIASIISIEDALASRLWEARFNAMVLGGFAMMALAVACLGVYAAVSYMVGTRRRELAVRIALGATRAEVIRIVMRSGATMLVPGLVGGLLGSFATIRIMRSLLYGADTVEPVVLGCVVSAIVGTALLSAFVPARRAADIEPATLLRSS